MKIHREGYPTIGVSGLIIALLLISAWVFFTDVILLLIPLHVVLIALWLFLLFFFRMPERKMVNDETALLSPADGKIVAIEEVWEDEFLKTNCRQISIFMSPLNVHVNRYPIGGKVVYFKYHHGKYLVAFHPKSSELNERSTIALQSVNGTTFLLRQIAGALARRIVCYSRQGDDVSQGSELGFIKFGSRVDVFIPLGYTVHVNLGDKVKSGISLLAKPPVQSE